VIVEPSCQRCTSCAREAERDDVSDDERELQRAMDQQRRPLSAECL
jgi:hypothetical protein